MDKKIPNHIAIIPDGNRRWAKKNKLAPWKGHKEGAERIEELSREALKMGVKYLTFWGSSKDNLKKRPLEEKRELLKIYEEYFNKLVRDPDVYENQTRIEIIGDWKNQFPGKLKKILEEGIEKTKGHAGNVLSFMLAYDGGEDVLEAAKRIKSRILEKGDGLEITKELFRESLLSSKLPDVDLLVRTGVREDPHNSAGFLMWQTQNSQYIFSEKLFPDFRPKDLKEAIDDFLKRERRMGK